MASGARELALSRDLPEEAVRAEALALEAVQRALDGKDLRRTTRHVK